MITSVVGGSAEMVFTASLTNAAAPAPRSLSSRRRPRRH